MLPINVPNIIRRLDHSRTYTLDDIVATSLIREVATKNQRPKNCTTKNQKMKRPKTKKIVQRKIKNEKTKNQKIVKRKSVGLDHHTLRSAGQVT